MVTITEIIARNNEIIARNNDAKEMVETFSEDFPDLRCWMYDSEYGPQIQVDNGKCDGFRIFYQGPASRFNDWALAFSDGWEACEGVGPSDRKLEIGGIEYSLE